MKNRNVSGHMLVGITFALGGMFAIGLIAAAIEIILGWPATVTAGILAVGAVLGGAMAFTDTHEIVDTTPPDAAEFEHLFRPEPNTETDTPWPTYDPFTKGDE